MDGEIIARVERRRQWTPQEKAALLAEVEASEPNSNHHSLSYDLPRTELDRVGRVHADLCRDFFSRAVALELSFFGAAYTSLCTIGNIRTCTTRVRLRVCAHARDECRSQSTGPECDAEPEKSRRA